MSATPSQIEWIPIDGTPGHPIAVAVLGSPAAPVTLDSTSDSVGFLAAILDASGNPFEWVELRVQETQHLFDLEPEDADRVTNRILDERWQVLVESIAKADAGNALFRGPWEREHPAPAFIDPESGGPAAPDGEWTLCTDDDLLESRRLAPFATTAHRYLINADRDRFIPLNDRAPRSPDTIEPDEAFAGLVPINREGGLMVVRRLPQLAFGEFCDLISGRNFTEEPGALLRAPIIDDKVGELLKSTGPANSGFLHAKGEPADRFSEILFLKLSLLLEAFRRVAESVAAHRAPLLGLTTESFSVRLAEPSGALPFLWDARVALGGAPAVVRVPLGQTGEDVIVPCEALSRSIYRTEHATERVGGTARVRIRKIAPPDDLGLSVIEGGLQTDESLAPSRKDILQLDLRFGKGRRIRIHANFVDSTSTTEGLRFLSLPMVVPEPLLEEIERGGAQFTERAEFAVLPRLGSTHDLFSLGVVACRVLVHDGSSALAETIDELLGLAEAYGASMDGSNWETGTGHLADFIASERGRRWRQRLGPACLVRGADPEDAASMIPARHWWQIVEFIGRLFPGSMPGAFRRDLDDFDVRFPERVFDAPIEALESILEHTRTLLFDSPAASREILGVIRGFSQRYDR